MSGGQVTSYGAHARATLVLGLPLIGSHLAQFAIGATDALMLGRYDVTALAAGVLGSGLFFVFLIVGAGFSWAVIPIVAGASETPDAATRIRRTTRMGLWLSLAFAVLALPVLLWSEGLFRLLGQEEPVAEAAGAYLRIAGWGIIPALAVMLLKAYLSALERTQVILWVTLSAVAINAVLNYALIFGAWGAPELGIRGSAIASLIVHVASALALAAYAVWAFPEHRLFQRIWRPDWEALRTVYRLGWPIGLTNFSEVGLFNFSAVMVGWVGEVPLAAHGIALQLASATFMVHLGLSNAATIRAGKAAARHAIGELRRGAGVVVAISVVYAMVTSAVFVAVPEPLIALYLPADDPDRATILALGATLLILAAAFQAVDGLQVVALGLLRGVQDTQVPMIYAAVSYWLVGVPVALVAGFSLGWGAAGVWLGLVVGLFCAAVLLLHRFWSHALPGLAGGAAASPAVP